MNFFYVYFNLTSNDKRIDKKNLEFICLSYGPYQLFDKINHREKRRATLSDINVYFDLGNENVRAESHVCQKISQTFREKIF